jgi:hypothetical protein
LKAECRVQSVECPEQTLPMAESSSWEWGKRTGGRDGSDDLCCWLDVRGDQAGVVHLCNVGLAYFMGGEEALFRVGSEAGRFAKPEDLSADVNDGVEPVAHTLNGAAQEEGKLAGLV